MSNYDAESMERRLAAEAEETGAELAGEARLDDLIERPPPEESSILEGVDSETRASWNLKRIRQLIGMSQQQLADKLAEGGVRMSQSQIAKIERGERPWRLNEFMAIEEALGVTPFSLFQGEYYKDDPSLSIVAAELRLGVCYEDENRVKEKWLDVARKRYEAEEVLLKVCADQGVRNATAMNVLRNRHSQDEYVQRVVEEMEEGFNINLERAAEYKKKSEEQRKVAQQYAEEQWAWYLEQAEKKRKQRKAQDEEGGVDD